MLHGRSWERCIWFCWQFCGSTFSLYWRERSSKCTSSACLNKMILIWTIFNNYLQFLSAFPTLYRFYFVGEIFSSVTNNRWSHPHSWAGDTFAAVHFFSCWIVFVNYIRVSPNLCSILEDLMIKYWHIKIICRSLSRWWMELT